MKIKSWICLTMTLIVGIAFAEDRDLVSVKGTGTGITEPEALKDAYRDAVETAVGLYVDAEQMVKNDEIVEDKILTQSNAYIESYDVLKKSTANGVCTIKILAKVKTKALTKKLSSTMKTQTVEVGSELQNLYANEVTKKKSGEEGAALLKNTLDKLDPVHSLIDISLANAKPAVLGRDEKSGEQKLGYLFKSAISEDRYFAEFMPRIREVLTQVAIGAPRQISLSVSGRQGLEFEKCFNAGMSGDHALRSQRCGATIVSPKLGEMSSAGSSSFSSQQHPCAVLVTKANKLRTVYSCEVYELDKHAAETLTGWWRDRMPSDYDSLIARLSFVDDEDEVLVQARVELGSCRWRMSCWLESFGNSIQSCMVIAPWFVQLSSFECYDWGKVSLPKEALPLVKKIKIDIVK